jgi:hypothetical protein
VFANVWEDSYIGYAGIAVIKYQVTESAESMTDKFINAWLTANPK